MSEVRLRGRVERAVEGLTPGYFALVMASGIVSVGMRVVLSAILLGVCATAFAAWTLVLVAMAVHLVCTVLARPRTASPRRESLSGMADIGSPVWLHGRVSRGARNS